MRAITGAELTRGAPGQRGPGDPLLTSPCWSRDACGYRNLCRLLTAAHCPHARQHRPRTPSQPWATLEQVEEHAEGLVCLSGCARDGALAGAWERGDTARGERLGRRLLGAFGRERFRVELQRPYWRHDRARNRWLGLLAARLGVPCVATGNVHSHSRRRARLQDAFVAVGLRRRRWRSASRARRGNRSSVLVSPGGDGRPLRRAPGGGRRDRAPGRAPALRSDQRARLPLPARGRRTPTSSSPALPSRGSPTATRGRARRAEAEAPPRARSWGRSATAASRASSSSTTSCWSWPARSRSRCAAATRCAHAAARAAGAAPASARSSAT